MGDTLNNLENESVLRHYRREWRIERVGWLAFLAIIVCGVAGFLGPGPLTSLRIESDDGSLALEYYSVEHNAAPGSIILRARPAPGATEIRLAMSRSFCDHVKVESIVPVPRSIEARDDEIVCGFAVAGSSPELVVKVGYEYDKFDVFDHRVALDGGRPIRFRQWVLP
jgi:hypothetical protein